MIKDGSVKFGHRIIEPINVLYPIGMFLFNERIVSSSTIRDLIVDNCSSFCLKCMNMFYDTIIILHFDLCNLPLRNILVTTSLDSNILFNSTQAPWDL